ncbi:crossover junction endodeoxyribonuclease RuvC [candidate division KSB1 bacterium]|nr:crossover junction endodeoxyribonuclease RuvC [candidate division KSB1 bacterium]
MKILGVDPGSLFTGFGIIKTARANFEYITSGVIAPNSREELADRLKQIYDGIQQVIADHQPEIVVIESVFYAQNVQSLLKLGQARGVVLLAAANRHLPLIEYSPREVKQSVTGNGAASKVQVHRSIVQMLNLTGQTFTHDEADALAIAICHSHRLKT